MSVLRAIGISKGKGRQYIVTFDGYWSRNWLDDTPFGSQEHRTAISEWAYENGVDVIYKTGNSVVFRNEADALLAYTRFS